MEPGHLCLLNYGEAPPLYNVRILLAPTSLDNWMVLTPDMDSFEEQMSPLNSDLTDFIYLGASTPAFQPGSPLIKFTDLHPWTRGP